MPNHITNKIRAPKHVILAALNDKGEFDFRTICPFPGQHGAEWDGIYVSSENAAKAVLGLPVSDHPMIAALERSNRRIDIGNVGKFSDAEFDQFVGMLRNYRSCEFLHSMDFARACWGTKWNAYSQKINLDEGFAQFQTAWSCPGPIFAKLASMFPDDEIVVEYADEDLGSNCGTLTLKGGAVVADIAPEWQSMSDANKKRWTAFARQVTGRVEDDEDDE